MVRRIWELGEIECVGTQPMFEIGSGFGITREMRKGERDIEEKRKFYAQADSTLYSNQTVSEMESGEWGCCS